ncbi:hypothetical protein SAMN05444159_0327 [Bradyrhizobium lablabi]|uniref:Uncharacterized protein n=1 Tax=Bradyrhizobium lablabi TaxID=722472 RepID=A0A1M6IEH8_9BRAD|nr:hypothetical protein SAMN05444159_0327 [Bradyrhizobium lablabi]
MPVASSIPMGGGSWVGYQKLKKGRDLSVPALFHVNAHAVVGLLACLTVVPVLVMFNVIPPPE